MSRYPIYVSWCSTVAVLLSSFAAHASPPGEMRREADVDADVTPSAARHYLQLEVSGGLGASSAVTSSDDPNSGNVLALGASALVRVDPYLMVGVVGDLEGRMWATEEAHLGVAAGRGWPVTENIRVQLLGEAGVHRFWNFGDDRGYGLPPPDDKPVLLPYAGARLGITRDLWNGLYVGANLIVDHDLGSGDATGYTREWFSTEPASLAHYHLGGTDASVSVALGWAI